MVSFTRDFKSSMDWAALAFTGLFQKVGPATAKPVSLQQDITRIVVCFYRQVCAEKEKIEHNAFRLSQYILR